MTRAEKRAVAVAALLLLASVAALVHPWYLRTADAAMYIATARSLAAGEGYRYLGEPFLVRPPGFSALLAPVIALRGPSNFAAMNGLVSLTGALGVVALYALARRRLGWPLALAAAAVLWLEPGYQRLCTSILSDVPGTAAALGCLWWASRARDADWRSELPLGLALGLAVWLRSANLLLLPAIALARVLAGRSDGGAGLAGWRAPLLGLLVAAPWFLYSAANASGEPADQTRLAGYATAMLHQDPGDPTSRRLGAGEIAARAPQRAVQLLAVLGSRLDTAVKGGRHDPTDAASGVRATGRSDAATPGALQLALGALLLAALVREAWRERGAPEWFALGSVAVLLFYFGFQDRLALPVFAVALVAALAWLRDVARRVLGESRGTAAAVAAAIALALIDVSPRAGWSEIRADHERMKSESEAIAPLLLPSDRAASWRGFHHGVFLERPIYSLHRSVGRLGPAAGTEAVIRDHDLDTIFLTVGGLTALRDHLNQRYGPATRSGTAETWRTQ
jgi:4-amino-4-deoxy-L-arabinose transferase-like glycosyltransferase